METRDMNWVATATGGTLRPGTAAVRFERVSKDSRTAGPGDLFVALRGERFDAHDFLPEVIARGVAGILVADGCEPRSTESVAVVTVTDTRVALGRMAANYRSEFSLPVVCVVGSNGKTTTKDLLSALVSSLGSVHRSEASFNNDVGVPLTLLGLGSNHRVAVLEAGTNHPGELAPLLASIAPQVGVLTGIGREHLEHFGSLEGVAEEEGTIASVLPPDGLLVLNGDSGFSDGIAARCRAEVVRFGEGAGNAWQVVSSRSTCCLLYTSPSPRDGLLSRMPSSA